MDRRELVRKVFHNAPAEKLLVAFWHHYLPDELVDGLHHPAYIRQNLEGARRFKEEFDPDFVKVMTDGLFFLPFDYDSVRTVSDLRSLRPERDLDAYYERTGVIIGADCTTHLETPDEHLHWVYEIAAQLSKA